MVKDYMKSAKDRLAAGDFEGAISAFLRGTDRGFPKCAFGLLQTVLEKEVHTMGEDEAVAIFKKAYPKIRRLADTGDAEAMMIVGQGIRLGLVEDEDEPYFFWLERAAALGNEEAFELLSDMDPTLAFGLPTPTLPTVGEPDGIDALLLDCGAPSLSFGELVGGLSSLLAREQVLIVDEDREVFDELGITELRKRNERERELAKSKGDDNYKK